MAFIWNFCRKQTFESERPLFAERSPGKFIKGRTNEIVLIIAVSRLFYFTIKKIKNQYLLKILYPSRLSVEFYNGIEE